MAESPPRVFTIPATTQFLPTLAAALVDGRLVPDFEPRRDPLLLADATVYLPTRRAARAFGAAILEALGAEAALLPRILPLGDVDEEELLFSDEDSNDDLPPAVTPANRRLVLAQYVLQWARSLARAQQGESVVSGTPAAALALADELAHVLDDLTLAEIPFERLEQAVPGNLDSYWDLSRKFLRIVKESWPAYLAETGRLDPTARRDALLARERERIANGASGPIIAAGSTGTLPAVAKLLAAISKRKDGAVVLPGLDQELDDPSFELIGKEDGADPSQGHPQFGLNRLLVRLGIPRAAVVALAAPGIPAREKLLSEVFRPAATTERWKQNSGIGDALDGISAIEAADPREEALAIAVRLRAALEEKDKYAALITPDRALARRVAAELTRWGIAVDDSAGTPLSESEAGRFARLAADAAAERLAPVSLLSFLRHPLSGFVNQAAAIDLLELGVLRGPRPALGTAGLVHAVNSRRAEKFHRNDIRANFTASDWDRAHALAEKAGASLSPLCALDDGKTHAFAEFLVAHREALQLAGLDLNRATRPDAEKLAEVFSDLGEAGKHAFDLRLSDYADVFAKLLAGTPLRPPLDPGARLRVLGPLEARLLPLDLAVLGGLNEGVWPPEARTDAFLNRSMRKELGLNLPERRIGLSAHDFVEAMGTPEVVITRARRQAGAETFASRSWQRLAAVAGGEAWARAVERGNSWLGYARALDRLPEKPRPIEKPAPKPPLAARPRQLSVTEIEDLVRDPYTIYAKHILRLFPLEEIDADPGAAERGTILHAALGDFTKTFPETLPKDALPRLLEFGRAAFAPFRDFPSAEAVWWPRFERVAAWMIGKEKERRENLTKVLAEIRGELSFETGGQSFTLTARADRIELAPDGVHVLDYKSGEPPTLKQAISGLAPQLPLEAAIAREGGFAGIAKNARIAGIAVFKLSGGNPPGKFISLDPAEAKQAAKKEREDFKIRTCDDLAGFSLRQLKELIARYTNPERPYVSIVRPKWSGRHGAYDHLARVKEWAESRSAE